MEKISAVDTYGQLKRIFLYLLLIVYETKDLSFSQLSNLSFFLIQIEISIRLEIFSTVQLEFMLIIRLE